MSKRQASDRSADDLQDETRDAAEKGSSSPLRPKVSHGSTPKVVGVIDDGDSDTDSVESAEASDTKSVFSGFPGTASKPTGSSSSAPSRSKGRRKKKSEAELFISYGAIALGGLVVLLGIIAALSGGSSTTESYDDESYEYEYYDVEAGRSAERTYDGSPPPMNDNLKKRLENRRRWDRSGGDFVDDSEHTQSATSGEAPSDGAANSGVGDFSAHNDDAEGGPAGTGGPDEADDRQR